MALQQIKIEVGKKYKDKRGNVVEILMKDDLPWYPFYGDNANSYQENGMFKHKPTWRDLIEEVKE